MYSVSVAIHIICVQHFQLVAALSH